MLNTTSFIPYSLLRDEVKRIVLQRFDSRQNACLDRLHPSSDFDFDVILPRKFREIRALEIACWFIPDDLLKWKIISELDEIKVYTDFSNKGLLNSVQIELFRDSENTMIKCLEQEVFFTKRQLFGTILQEDLRNALNSLRIKRKNFKVRRKVRRKGYQDKGTWRSSDRWLERFDYSFVLEQQEYEKKLLLIKLFTQLYKLRL